VPCPRTIMCPIERSLHTEVNRTKQREHTTYIQIPIGIQTRDIPNFEMSETSRAINSAGTEFAFTYFRVKYFIFSCFYCISLPSLLFHDNILRTWFSLLATPFNTPTDCQMEWLWRATYVITYYKLRLSVTKI
jgi:hypothetical protein